MKKLLKILAILLVFNSINSTEKDSDKKTADDESRKFVEQIFTGPKYYKDFGEFDNFVKSKVTNPKININYIRDGKWTPLTALMNARGSYEPAQALVILGKLLQSPDIDVNIPKNDELSPLDVFASGGHNLFGKAKKQALKLLLKKGAIPTESFLVKVHNNSELSKIYKEALDELTGGPLVPPMPGLPKNN